jgi:Transglutaminase-like superfamily
VVPVRFVLATLVLTSSFAAAGPPSPLAVKPTEALNKLAQLDGRNPAISKDEDRLFEDAKQGKFGRVSFSEACLLAGGVSSAHDRKKYIAKLDAIEVEARKATAGSKSVKEDGDRLLKYLHTGPMAKGYKTEQTDLQILLDTGEFNCVSSAVLYTVMGQRLGIDVRAVEIPGHVFSVLATRDRKIDVETTSPRGFDVDPLRQHGPAKANRPVELRREVGPPGLAAMVAFNHGVTLTRDKRFAESIRANLFALGLDSDNWSAARNLVVGFENWAVDLAKGGKYEKAMAVVSIGRELTPKDPAFQKLTVAVCDAWAKEYVDRQDWTGAVQVYTRGLREFPNDKHLTNNLMYCRSRMP